MQIYKLIMKHIQDHINHPTELFTSLFVYLTGKNEMAVDAGGLNAQMLDTFSNAMCYNFFYLSTMIFFMNQIVASSSMK